MAIRFRTPKIALFSLIGLAAIPATASQWTASTSGNCTAVVSSNEMSAGLTLTPEKAVRLSFSDAGWNFTQETKIDVLIAVPGRGVWGITGALFQNNRLSVDLPNNDVGIKIVRAFREGNELLLLTPSEKLIQRHTLKGSAAAIKELLNCNQRKTNDKN